jgi:GNAT superfamily N-acetyltransferase
MPAASVTASPDLNHDRIRGIETAASRAWPTIERQPLGGWVLRCGRAGSRRLNSVQTLAYGDAELGEAIATAERWYRARLTAPCFQLTDAAQPAALDALLEERGYALLTPTSVMLATEWPEEIREDDRIQLLPEADGSVLDAICDRSWSEDKKRERIDLFARIESRHCFALIVEDGEPIAGGLCAVDGKLAGLFTMRTQPPHRGRGLASAIARRLMTWAYAQGARESYLQVEDDNAPALHLYRQLGFVRVYGYHYRERGMGA